MTTQWITTGAGRLRITLARHIDFPAVYSVFCDAAAWLQTRGIDQWAWMLTERGQQVLRNTLADDVYLAWRENEPVGTLRLLWEEDDPWDARGRDGQAGYVHGFAVKRTVAGAGVGAALLAWAAEQAAQHGRVVQRLDCLAANPDLCAYYERLGFVSVGEGMLHVWKERLYERPIAPVIAGVAQERNPA